MKTLLALTLCFFGLTASIELGFAADKETEAVRLQLPSHNLTANELYSAYKTNEVAADVKYKNQVVLVSGAIQKIGKDILDQSYVLLGGKGFLDGVQCFFSKDEALYSVVRLEPKQLVTIKGRVSGKMGNVLLKGCILQ